MKVSMGQIYGRLSAVGMLKHLGGALILSCVG
jgi:hypothetical protein